MWKIWCDGFRANFIIYKELLKLTTMGVKFFLLLSFCLFALLWSKSDFCKIWTEVHKAQHCEIIICKKNLTFSQILFCILNQAIQMQDNVIKAENKTRIKTAFSLYLHTSYRGISFLLITIVEQILFIFLFSVCTVGVC